MSALASYCDVSPQAVKQWVDENGTSPRGKRLKKIAEFFNISESELAYGIVPSHNDEKSLASISPQAQRLINAIIKAETSGSSSPKLIDALEKVLDVAIPTLHANDNADINRIIGLINETD